MGLRLIQYVPLVAFIGLCIMCLVSLAGRPRWGLYYLIPFLPYRSLRVHFIPYPLGTNMLTILIFSVIIGGLIHGKRLPKSNLYLIWLAMGVYLYFSMWMGTLFGIAPAPLWLSDMNFVVWKDYMLIPLVLVATSLVVEDRKNIRMIIIVTAITLLLIDRSTILGAMSRTWTSFDESKRDLGPLSYGPNLTAAFLAQFAMFIWGVVLFVKAKRYKILGYGLIALTLFGTMYTFSRGGYLAVLIGVLILGILKDRKLLVILGIFLLTWQTIVPNAVRERVTMTKDASGQLESSAQQRVDLWKESWDSFVHRPIAGNGFATFQYGQHVAVNLKDTHNMFVKVMVETGVIGLIFVFALIQQALALGWRLFRSAVDPLYRGLGLGLILAMCSCIVANCFGDRWTYIEVSGPLWVLIAAGIRAWKLMAQNQESELSPLEAKASLVS